MLVGGTPRWAEEIYYLLFLITKLVSRAVGDRVDKADYITALKNNAHTTDGKGRCGRCVHGVCQDARPTHHQKPTAGGTRNRGGSFP